MSSIACSHCDIERIIFITTKLIQTNSILTYASEINSLKFVVKGTEMGKLKTMIVAIINRNISIIKHYTKIILLFSTPSLV
jgi:hypothetical protein